MAENGEQKPNIKEEVRLDDKSNNYIKDLLKEKSGLDPATHSHAMRLIDEEIKHVQSKGMYNKDVSLYMDVLKDKPVRITSKVIVPIKEHPKFNFMGQLLGPKGSSLKRLQDETMTKMAILGKGSMKDRSKEEEYRNSLDPKYSHLNDELHVEVAAFAGPAEAHARLAYALAELKKYLTPETLTNEQRGMAGGPMRSSRMPRGGLPPRPLLPHPHPSKSKVLSILDRARQALNPEPYPEDPYFDAPPPPDYNGQPDYYDSYPPPPPPPEPVSSRWKGFGRSSSSSGRYGSRSAPYSRPGK